MNFKIKMPITSSQRHLLQLNLKNLRKKPIIKNKLKGLKNCAGKNHSGKITVRHKGGGHKTRYRQVNFYRTNESSGIILSIEYDPYRNAHIASVYDLKSRSFFYMIAPKSLKIGDIVKSGSKAEPKLGHSMPIGLIPLGSYVNNVSCKIFGKSEISRSAGTFSYLKEKSLKYAKIEVSSGELKLIPIKCYASIGIVSNDLVSLTKLGKAGRSRWLNIRPTVRGVAMNPVDHPHGGGEGKKSGVGKTPWGKRVKIRKTNKIKRINYE
jgi:large subunit ribosomal protein L2